MPWGLDPRAEVAGFDVVVNVFLHRWPEVVALDELEGFLVARMSS